MLRNAREDGTVVLTIDRPQAKNAIGREILDGLKVALDAIERDHSVRAVILTGAGDTFASGGDLRELREATTAAQADAFADEGENVCRRFGALDVPVFAALPGLAFGGGAELALACDARIGDDTARFAFKQVRMGVTTAWGTVPRLVAAVGASGAARLLLTGHEVSAHEAHALGLLDHVAARGEALAVAHVWARDVASSSPRAVAEMKALLRTARAALATETLRREERSRFVATWTSDDHAIAVEAYFARKPPKWPAR